MRESWLIVNRIGISKKVYGTQFNLIKRVEGFGKKADKLAEYYQNELNKGRSMEECVAQKKDYWSVCSIPWSQAREYTNFMKWPCNKDFDA